jgi:glycosyltransferase involved in cell wall biosynthesis
LAAADLAVRPTPEPGTSLAVVEALAAGLPVVASDIPAHREWITDGRNGLLASPNDRAAWSAAIDRLWTEPGLAARLGVAARRRAAEASLAKMADAHLTLFEGLRRSRDAFAMPLDREE